MTQLPLLRRLFWIALAGLIALSLVATLAWPYGYDQGISAWVGSVILDGGMPYRDAWDARGPGVHLLFALVQWVFGREMWGLRLFDLVWQLAGGTAVYLIARRSFDATAARWSVALLLLWYVAAGWWQTAQPEGWLAVLLSLLTLLLIRSGRPGGRAAVVAGLLLGTAVLLKPPYALYLFLLPLVGLVRWPGERAAVLRAVAVTTTIVAGIGGAALLWFALRGALPALMEIQLGYLPTVYLPSGVWPGRIAFLTRQFIVERAYLLAALPFALAGIAAVRRERSLMVALLGWTAVAAVIILLHNKFFLYHWLAFYPPLALLAGAGVSQLRQTKRVGVRTAGLAGTMALLALSLYTPLLYGLNWSTAVIGRRTWAEHDRVFRAGDYNIPALQETAVYLQAHTTPEETVYLWGNHTYLTYASGRRLPTRFGFADPLNRSIPGGRPNPYLIRYRAELLRDLAKRPPAYIIVVAAETDDPPPRPAADPLAHFPELAALLADGYTFETAVGPYDLYRRR